MHEPSVAIQSASLDLPGQHVAYLRTSPSRPAAADGSDLPRGRLAHGGRSTSPPTLVFIHGWAADKVIWIGLMKRLGGARPTVALDLPGHGGSFPAAKAYSPDGMATTVREALGALHIRDCVVIGHSMGTLVTLALALGQETEDTRETGNTTESGDAPGPVDGHSTPDSTPLRLRGIVLCNPPHAADMRRHLGPWRSDRLLRILLAFGRRTYRALGWRASMDATGRLAALRRRAAAYGAVPTEVLLGTARMLESVDLSPRLARVRVPTLVILGRYDLLTPARGGRLVAGGIPGSAKVELNTGHEAMDSHEALLARVIGDWLRERGF